MPGEVSFKNAFRARKAQYGSGCEDLRKPLPQMFTFVARTALPDSGQGLALRERVPHFLRAGDHGSSEDDVFCLVKEAMSSRSLSQDPLLVFPANLVPASQKFLADANSEGCPLRTWRLDGERWDELKAIRGALRNDFPHMVRAVRWYEQFLRNPQPQPDVRGVPQLSFLRNVCARQQDWHAFQLGRRPPAPKPYELQVVFHRDSAH